MTETSSYPELIVIDLDAILAEKAHVAPDFDAVEFGADMFAAPPEALKHFTNAATFSRKAANRAA